MGKYTRLDEVTVFDGRLRFLIPHDWAESDEDDDPGTYLYRAPDSRSGWFRVSIIWINTSGDPRERLKEVFGSRDGAVVDEQTGNLVQRSEKDTEQNEVPLHIYYWMVANSVQPNLVYQAVFSYTILLEHKNTRQNKETMALIDSLVSRAEFFDHAESIM